MCVCLLSTFPHIHTSIIPLVLSPATFFATTTITPTKIHTDTLKHLYNKQQPSSSYQSTRKLVVQHFLSYFSSCCLTSLFLSLVHRYITSYFICCYGSAIPPQQLLLYIVKHLLLTFSFFSSVSQVVNRQQTSFISPITARRIIHT